MIILSNSGSKSGLNDWILQRLTGLYIAIYLVFICYYLSYNDNFNYISWIDLFSSFFFKIFTILFIFCLSLHLSIGLNIILTDYIKQVYVRLILDFMINIILLSYIFCIMQILWGF